MKISEIKQNFISNITQLFKKESYKTNGIENNLLEGMEHNPLLQPTTDSFETSIKLKDLKLGDEINRGKESIVYNILNHPNLVAKINYYAFFYPEKLSYKNNDSIKHIIAATDDFNVVIMQKIKGEPLFGKNWINKRMLTPDEYFSQLDKLKKIPDKAFIKYYYDLLELRKRGYDLDTVNPNNILYDDEKQCFNFVDVVESETEHVVEVTDFYPFIDGAAVGLLYQNSSFEVQKKLEKETQLFWDRIEKIGNKIGVFLSNKNYIPDHNYIPYKFEDD